MPTYVTSANAGSSWSCNQNKGQIAICNCLFLILEISQEKRMEIGL